MALACFVHFLYTVRSTVSKKYTKQANRQKTRKYKKKHHTHTHKLSVQKHPRLGLDTYSKLRGRLAFNRRAKTPLTANPPVLFVFPTLWENGSAVFESLGSLRVL